MNDQAKLPRGKVLDNRYQVLSLVNSGGMGAVYKALDTKLDKICAIKEMTDAFDTVEERQAGIDRFRSEVGVMLTLMQPNIPRVTDYFVEGSNNFYFVLEFVDGVDLSTLLTEQGQPGLPYTRVLEWVVQVCDALEYLHLLRPPVIHRDLKPSNLILRQGDEHVMLIDFGIARVTNPAAGFWIGTPGYAPPEQQCGKHETRSDLYALGAVLHELISGKKPTEDFTFKTFEELRVPHVPAGLWPVVEKALQLHPNDRYASAGEMRQALLDVLGYVPAAKYTESFAFAEAVGRLKDDSIDPQLGHLIRRYGDECQTPCLPKQLERLVFTLGYPPTPFELIIQVNEKKQAVDFIERQGILDPVALGQVTPGAEGAHQEVHALVERFVDDYEAFKNSSWQLSF